jgi:diamine N-acetyltransferase
VGYLVDKVSVKFIHGNQALLDQVRALWEALNSHHLGLSTNFRQHYKNMTFEKRKAGLLKKAKGGELHVDIALDLATGRAVGYLISCVNLEKTGEIESVYVDPAYRHKGVGAELMRNALAWMDQKGAMEKVVEVSVGNEAAWGFYGRFGFLPRKTLLKQVKKA